MNNIYQKVATLVIKAHKGNKGHKRYYNNANLSYERFVYVIDQISISSADNELYSEYE